MAVPPASPRTGTDRRTLLTGAAAAVGAAGLVFRPGPALAQSGDLPALTAAVAEGKAAAITRIQEWIRRPAIAAENRDMKRVPTI